MGALKDLTGKRFGRLTVLGRGETHILPSGQRQTMWNCICECGNTTCVSTGNLRSKRIVSCGCYNRTIQQHRQRGTHHCSHTRLYDIWHKMRQRCFLDGGTSYNRYGGRGITVCEEWNSSFENFQRWAFNNGYSDSLSIDRIDTNGNYEPNNCRWVTMKIQENNRTNNVIIEYKGKYRTVAEWADEYGLKYTTLYRRLERGWSLDRALTTPVKKKRCINV